MGGVPCCIMCRDEQAVEFIFDRWGHANLISVRCAVRFLLVHFIFGSEHIYLRNTRVPAVLLGMGIGLRSCCSCSNSGGGDLVVKCVNICSIGVG